MAIVELIDVHKTYPLGKTEVKAVRGVDLRIEVGEFSAIAGPSGSGKTTLLNLIGCVDIATKGQVLVDGEDTGKLTESKRTTLRLHKIGFIFQSFNLINVLDVFDNVEFPLLLQGGMTKKERKERVLRLVDAVGLSKQLKQRPGELSGGQRQRVAIARALVTNPKLVLADEPTANLDSVTGDQIIDLMQELNQTQKVTFLFSTHDQQVMQHADRIIKLMDGKVLDDGLSGSEAAPETSAAASAAV